MKRGITAVVIGGAVFTGATAFAASLGGVTPQNLGADNSVVASCDTDGVAVAWNVSYDDDGTDIVDYRYELTDADVSGIDVDETDGGGCVGQRLSLTVVGADDLELGEATVVIGSSGTENISFDGDDIDPEAVEHVHVLITPDASESA